MTEKLFYEDSFLKEFDAVVLRCCPMGEKYEVVLNRTAFFPEGGGQYADTGWLGEAEVLDVQERGDEVFHYVTKPLPEGETVHGGIRWEERFMKMQQHTGEHIVSGIIHRKFGYNNVGFHLGSEDCTMDFDGEMTLTQLREVETEVNQAVFSDLTVEESYPSKEALNAMSYRSKIEIEGQVRIVTIPGYDVCACCAPHVKRTGEIGIVKLIDSRRYKGGMRVTMLCGVRALEDYRRKEASVKRISSTLCAKNDVVAEAVEQLKADRDELKNTIVQLQRQLMAHKVKDLPEDEDVIWLFEPDLEGSGPRELMNLVLGSGKRICGVFAGNREEGYRYVVGSRREDVRPIAKELNEQFQGRGGGKSEMVQGSLKGTEEALRKILVKIRLPEIGE